MCKVLDAVTETMNPKGGHGILETAVIIILVLAYVCFIAQGIAIPPEFVAVISAVTGYLFGRNEPKE